MLSLLVVTLLCDLKDFFTLTFLFVCLFPAVLQQAGRNPSFATLNKYWTPTTSKLNFDDFCEILKSERKTEEAELMRVFKKMDTNGDGYITHSQLEKDLTTVRKTLLLQNGYCFLFII